MNTHVHKPTAPRHRRLGAVLWFRWIREHYESVYAYATVSGRDRSTLRRQLTGERSDALPVETAIKIKDETGGAVPVESWGAYSDRPVVESIEELEAELGAPVAAAEG